jgi:hypothetical protein
MSFYIEHEFTAQGHVVECLFTMHRNLESSEEIEYIDCIPIIIFTAFAIESYLNGIGARVADFWDSVEKINWKNKINILHSLSGKEPNWGAEPLSFISEVFKIRDRFAHGKPEINRIGPYDSYSDAGKDYHEVNSDPEWILKLNAKWLKKSKLSFIKAMEYLRDLHDLPDNDHLLVEKTTVVENNV